LIKDCFDEKYRRESTKNTNGRKPTSKEAVINHRTIAAFSSEKRMLRFFKATFRGPKEESVKHFRFWPV
jgi:ATP-binding cassette subfamily B (MDR/TAP) protein 1